MPTIDRTVDVDQPAEKVWAFVSDFRTTEQWDPPTQRTTRESGDGGVGTVYRNISRFVGRDVEVTYEAVRYEPPHRLELAGRTGSMRLHDTITVETVGDRTRVRYVAEMEPQGLAKLALPLMPLALKRLGDRAAASLREHLGGL
jgi:carbon monoxide dehydrogenase subunit G